MEKELGHPILAFTMARVLPGADCPLTVGLCEGPLHSPSDYAASLRQRQGKEPGRMWADALRVGGGGAYYSMTHITALDGAWTSTVVERVVMGTDRFCLKLQRQDRKRRRVRDRCRWLAGPLILSADVPRVSVEDQQRSSAQQMLQETMKLPPPTPHPLSQWWENEKQAAGSRQYESNDKRIL